MSRFINGYLVGGLEHFLFFHILGIINPADELIFFTGVQTTNQLNYIIFPEENNSFSWPQLSDAPGGVRVASLVPGRVLRECHRILAGGS